MEPMIDRPRPDGPPAEHVRRPLDHAIAYGLIAIILVLVYRIFAPLFTAILWGVLLEIVCAHPYERLAGRLHGRRIVADIVFGAILVMVLLVPAAFFAWEVTVHFPVVHQQIERLSSAHLPPLPDWVAGLPMVGPQIQAEWAETGANFVTNIPAAKAILATAATWLLEQIGSFGTFLFQFALGAVISLFLLHNRFRVNAAVYRLLHRVGGDDASRLAMSAFNTTRAAFAGVVASAIAQTFLASIAIFAVGLPVVLMAGFTFLLAMVQIGPIVVMLAADAILLVQGDWVAAVLLTVWFLGAVMSVDNFVRPYFATRGSDTPGIFSFLGAIGGFLSWGLIGVFVGPVLISVLYEMFVTWIDRDEPPRPHAA